MTEDQVIQTELHDRLLRYWNVMNPLQREVLASISPSMPVRNLDGTYNLAATPSPQREEDWDEAEGMCPNCCTPWKCNGPHLHVAPPQTQREEDHSIQLHNDAAPKVASAPTTSELLTGDKLVVGVASAGGEEPVLYVALVELQSAAAARKNGDKWNTLAWSEPTGQAGIPLFTRSAPALPSVKHVGEAGASGPTETVVVETAHAFADHILHSGLLPCPFCGTSSMDTCNKSGVFPECVKMERTGSYIARCGNPECAADVMGGSIEEARERWNRRAATPSPQREPMAGARTACHAEEPG